MTEKQWLAHSIPEPMLAFLRGKVSERKLRLFACACCRRIWHLLVNERSRKAVEVSEQFADGGVDREALALAWGAAAPLPWELEGTVLRTPETNFLPADLAKAARAAQRVAEDEPIRALSLAAEVIPQSRAVKDANKFQAMLLRDVFGNPFQPVTVNPVWRSATVVSLAQAIYEERAFERMPILGDALEEAGCDNADGMAHCRGPEPHVRGCWVVDLLLDKK